MENILEDEFEFLKKSDLLDCLDNKHVSFEKLFYKLNNKICCELLYNEIDTKALSIEIEKTFSCKKYTFSSNFDYKAKEYFDNRFCYFITNDLIVVFGMMFCGVYIYYSYATDTTKLNKLKTLFEKAKRWESVSQTIGLLHLKNKELEVLYFDVNKVELDIARNYNDDFVDFHKIIYSRLQTKNDKGLVLLYGKPGTGKTNYIRYMVTLLKKDVIILPADFAEVLTSPEFLSFLVLRKNSILVFEDAENIVMERRGGKNIAVANLLNICDGMLSDCLNIQIICTFNNDISKIDKALMRKGRLIGAYEFGPLAREKAQVLSESLGFQSKINAPMTLAEIYNQNEKEFETQRQTIGFRKE